MLTSTSVPTAQAGTLSALIVEKLSAPRERAFADHRGSSGWTYASSTEVLTRARAIATALHDDGVANGDRVAIIADNSVDWLVALFGSLLAGAIPVPIFRTIAQDQLDFIFDDAQTKLAFVQTVDDARRIGAACPHAPRSITFETGDDALAALEVSALGRCDADTVAAFTQALAPSDLALLIYTSGTTGDPKGVMLTHDNLISNARATIEHLFRDPDIGPVLSVLPLAHVMAMNAAIAYLYYDVEQYIATPDTLLDDLRSVRPRSLSLVPRVFERMRAGIIAQASAEGGLKAKLVPWALGVGVAAMCAAERPGGADLWLRLRFALAKALVLDKIKPTLGLDRIRLLSTGSAALHPDIARLFASFGLPLCEGYGMTEAGPVVTINPPERIRIGSVGVAIPGVSIRLAADGEIEVRGRGVMNGYYRRANDDAFTSDGWLRTGDVGTLDADGYLFITDRKKELLKTTTGKYVAPSRVEAAIKRSAYVGQVVVTGDGRPYPVALVVPNWPLVRMQFAIPDAVSNATIAERRDVADFLESEVARATADLATYEGVRHIALLPRDLTTEDGDLSPTMKVKRRVVERTFAHVVDGIYLTADDS